MTPREKVRRIIEIFSKIHPNPTTELHYRTPYELFVAVVLSAQCTDARVNLTTPDFFREYPDFSALAQADPGAVAQVIRSISYPNSKARSLVKAARKIVEEYGGQLPADLAELQKIPGVGRKTANVLGAVLFQLPALPVDTHVFRVSKRLGLVPATLKTPEQVERALLKIVPPEERIRFHHWLILHGRYVCKARKPLCEQCPLTMLCDDYQQRQRQPTTRQERRKKGPKKKK